MDREYFTVAETTLKGREILLLAGKTPPDHLSVAVSDFTTFAVMAHSGRDRLIAVAA